MSLIKITEQDGKQEVSIEIKNKNGKQAVSARELHKFLEVTERFSYWFERQLQYGFVEFQDYIGCKEFNTLANQELIDFAMSLDMAKEISMIQRSEKGKIARQYFIECEKKLQTNTYKIPQNYSEALKLAYEQALKIEEQEKQLEEQAPKVLFTDAVVGSKSSCLVGDLAKIITQNGVKIGQNRLFQYLREKGYLGTKGERRNMPNQAAVEKGLFEIKIGTRTGNDGELITIKTAKVTGRGQVYFINKFLKNKERIQKLWN